MAGDTFEHQRMSANADFVEKGLGKRNQYSNWTAIRDFFIKIGTFFALDVCR